MHIIMITPAPEGSRAGNRATALRWQALLQDSGHRVEVKTDYRGEPCDLFIGLHAWRSHSAIKTFYQCWPFRPLIVALTGTDLYRYQHDDPEPTHESMELADALIGLHDKVGNDIPSGCRDRLVTLRQSAPVPPEKWSPGPPGNDFSACVIGHLRSEKDSLRAAKAALLLPADSRVRIVNAGKPHDERWSALVRQEQAENPRFSWLGELSGEETQNLMVASSLMVISSLMEGGANVVSEACRAGVPILASDIPGNRGLLGDDYKGYFPAGDEQALARLLRKAETDAEFLAALASQVTRLAPGFSPERERASLEQALNLAIGNCAKRRKAASPSTK
ncbi:TIGR04348 family glycosyltransferase [Marinobacter salinexigens]|uniref:TIGR04348 family glycosyltransferase n=1 Tax=Marinobacter salinexigens TaxID=2919747 RepID=A0A5B0V8M2_9GAMM|nr:selenoneine biosynthesis selenosugar synthase SenB [Marinobacter salinexigens]KAA1171026.1 TIGR04348 family glycosyltransferase [Marinobacter salinexigens]